MSADIPSLQPPNPEQVKTARATKAVNMAAEYSGPKSQQLEQMQARTAALNERWQPDDYAPITPFVTDDGTYIGISRKTQPDNEDFPYWSLEPEDGEQTFRFIFGEEEPREITIPQKVVPHLLNTRSGAKLYTFFDFSQEPEVSTNDQAWQANKEWLREKFGDKLTSFILPNLSSLRGSDDPYQTSQHFLSGQQGEALNLDWIAKIQQMVDEPAPASNTAKKPASETVRRRLGSILRGR